MAYAYAFTLTVDRTKCGSSGAIPNFPVYFAGGASFATVANGGLMQNANGYDQNYYADASHTIPLYYELVPGTYNALTGAMEVWINCASGAAQVSSAANAVIYGVIGDAAITTFQSTATLAWDTNFKGVWHFPNGTSLGLLDSTANGNNGTGLGATGVSAGPGQVDGGIVVAGTLGYADMGDTSSLDITGTKLSMSCWINITSHNSFGGICGKGRDAGNLSAYQFYFNGAANTVQSFLYTTGAAGGLSTASLTGAWHLIDMVYDGATVQLYVDGAADTSAAQTGNVNNSADPFQVGRYNSAARGVTGTIDEVRVSDTNRSAGWVAAEYNNQLTPSTFYTLSAFTPLVLSSQVILPIPGITVAPWPHRIVGY